MRHRMQTRRLNRTTEHRKALLRNMAQSLVEHGQITTTVAKAKAIKPYLEKVITLAVATRKRAAANDNAGSLRARRALHKMLGDRGVVPADHQLTYNDMSDAARAKSMRMASGRRYRTGDPKGRLVFTAESVTRRVIEKIAPRFEDRPGGYTRLVLLPDRRIGDSSQLAMVQLVGDEEVPRSLTRPRKSARRRRADARYGMAIRLAKGWPRRDRPEPEADAPAEAEAEAGTDESVDQGDQADDTGTSEESPS